MTETLSGLFLLIVLIYFAEQCIYAFGIFRAARPADGGGAFSEPQPIELSHYPLCTVLVCARDEEKNIGSCVESLHNLNYPNDRLQVLIVDDKSTDRTPEILREWKARMPNLEVLRTGEEVMHMRGKVNALTQGLDAARGEFVMITDADCQVQPNWVTEYVRRYSANTGMVAGITLLNTNYFLDNMQSIDLAYTLGIAMSGTNLKIPLSVIGNNISIRRKAYEDVGGYRNIPFSVTEDYALFQAIWNHGSWKVRFPLHKDLTVMSEAMPTFRAWWRQKHRWVKGGQGLEALGYLIFILAALGNIAMVASFFLLPLYVALAVVAIKWAGDLLIILPVVSVTRTQRLLKYFPVYEIYLAFFVFAIPIMLMQKNVKWKGRVYTK